MEVALFYTQNRSESSTYFFASFYSISLEMIVKAYLPIFFVIFYKSSNFSTYIDMHKNSVFYSTRYESPFFLLICKFMKKSMTFITSCTNTIVGNYNKTHTKQGVTHLHKKVWRWMRKLHLHLKNSLSLKPNIIIMIQVQHSWTYIRLKTIIITDNLIFRLPHRH
jgi:hypothetical protein